VSLNLPRQISIALITRHPGKKFSYINIYTKLYKLYTRDVYIYVLLIRSLNANSDWLAL